MIISKPKIKAGKRQKVVYFGYSKATAGGGATVKSTSAGGATTRSTSSGGQSTQTSSSGGATSKSTSSGGGSSQSSSSAGTHRHKLFGYVGDGTVPGDNLWGRYEAPRASDGTAVGLTFLPGAHGDIYTNTADGSHSHSVPIPNHTHDFEVPAHTHNVSIPAHTHDVTIPAHTHDIDLPNHTHDVQHEIVELSELPSSVTIKVDGNVIPHTAISGNRINLVDYLAKDSSGRITRGRHEVEILPNGLARIEADLICRVFIQSQLGGTY